MIMPRIDRGYDRMLAVLADDGGGKGGQCGYAYDRLVRRERDAAGSRKADAQSGKAAGTGRRRDAVEFRERNARCFHHARDQRHQGFGMATLHRLRFLRDEIACGGVENGRGAGIERRIDSEDQHGASVELFQRRLNEQLGYFPRFIHRETRAASLYL